MNKMRYVLKGKDKHTGVTYGPWPAPPTWRVAVMLPLKFTVEPIQTAEAKINYRTFQLVEVSPYTAFYEEV